MPSTSQPGWLSLHDALTHALTSVTPVNTEETVALSGANGRILAADVVASMDVPPWDNSAMDGYAIRCEDAALATAYPVSATLLAGMTAVHAIQPGTVVRIMTGAPIPAGADCVVMQENTTADGDKIVLTQLPKSGENVRPRGNDMLAGTTLITKGTRLTPRHIMLLASQGQAHVSVLRKLKVGVVATGDELAAPGEPCKDGQIYESNRLGILAMLSDWQVDAFDLGIVKDDKAALHRAMGDAASTLDLLISSGGVSVGDADYVKDILAQLGHVTFWKVAIKPGKPFAFGRLGNAVFCGLPGNPVSAYVTFEQLVVPVLRQLQGEQQAQVMPVINAKLLHDIKRRAGRQDFQRARATQNEQGEWQVAALPNQSSGVMTSLTNANCYLIIEKDTATLAAGSNVRIQLFSQTR